MLQGVLSTPYCAHSVVQCLNSGLAVVIRVSPGELKQSVSAKKLAAESLQELRQLVNRRTRKLDREVARPGQGIPRTAGLNDAALPRNCDPCTTPQGSAAFKRIAFDSRPQLRRRGTHRAACPATERRCRLHGSLSLYQSTGNYSAGVQLPRSAFWESRAFVARAWIVL